MNDQARRLGSHQRYAIWLASKVAWLRNWAFFVSDIVLLPLCAFVAFSSRYEGVWDASLSHVFNTYLVISLPLKLAVVLSLGLYRRLWRYASVDDLEHLVTAAVGVAVVDAVVGVLLVPRFASMPGRLSYAVILLDTCLSAVVIAAPRLAVRIIARRDRRSRRIGSRRAIVVGAGVAGGMIVRELMENAQIGITPVAMLDDDPYKHGLRIHNVPVLGPLSALEEVSLDVAATDIVIAMPSAPGLILRDVLRHAQEAGLETRTVPGLYEIISGEKRVSTLRQIEIQDLLRRQPIKTDIAQVASLVTGKVVMVTGAGGSIGSELCRQLARLDPESIVAVGRGENSIFELLQEMGRAFPHVHVEPVIGDVRDFNRIRRAIADHRPFTVVHAAAHKHVPLMEESVAEAVLNNVLGTQNVVSLSTQYDVEHFVLISTDKAVRPTSVMGATKRIAEFIVHEVAEKHSRYVAVRFGNVLGSRGSVVPTFMRQIAAGGPVTITHRDMTRYFMTIPEAVQLVLQAAAMGAHGEVFVLDMDEPIRVLDLATDMIRLSGLEVGKDIEIKFLGVRPGEKLYEELFFGESVAARTSHPKILRARDSGFPADGHGKIERLIAAASMNRPAGELRDLIRRLVPEYVGVLDDDEYSLPESAERIATG